MIGLCDCNNFFVSCQRLFDPSLVGRPVVVLSGNDGCIIARSNEAKALGIKMGQPRFEIDRLLKQNNVVLISSNLELYTDISKRVMETLRMNVPEVEVYSVDEAFLNLEGMELDDLQEYGRRLSRLVRRNTGIPVSIGISHNKTLSKIASKLAKQYPRLEGCCLMYREEDIAKVLSTYPIEDVWGIGRRYASMLHGFGVRTAEQFRRMDSEWVQSKMSVVGLRTQRELLGESCMDFEVQQSSRQSIMVSRTFASELYEFEDLHQVLSGYLSRAAEKLRAQGSKAGELEVFLRTNRFRDDIVQQNEGRSFKFMTPTNSTLEMATQMKRMLGELYINGNGYKRAGVLLKGITSAVQTQTSLFVNNEDAERHAALMKAVDKINRATGGGSSNSGMNGSGGVVRLASEGFGGDRRNSDYISPCYSTRWSDILTVKV